MGVGVAIEWGCLVILGSHFFFFGGGGGGHVWSTLRLRLIRLGIVSGVGYTQI